MIKKTIESKYLSGIDEAGRGCVLGPMVMGLCVISKDKESFFREQGVKDSKLLSPKKREELFDIIKREVDEYKLLVVPAEELNVLMDRYSLNEIEAQKEAEMISKLKTDIFEIIVDSPDTVADKFKRRIDDCLRVNGYEKKIKIISEHKADLNHIVVGCASILAKVTRDRLLEELIGKNISGYSSDQRTIEYLKSYILEHKQIPPFARSKWETIDKVMKELYQKKIGWFK